MDNKENMLNTSPMGTEVKENAVTENAAINTESVNTSESTANESTAENTATKASVDVTPEQREDGMPPFEEKKKNHRGKGWFTAVFIALFLVFIIPMVTVGIVVFALPPVYTDTFIGELGDKYERLKSIDEPKIVIIGGSSVAFGIDSALMEEKLGMKVVNFGLYANLGTKLMIDLSRANINEGDIVIIAPEMSAQTLSLYFNAETFMQALDGNPSMLLNIDTKNYESIVGASWKFAYEKLNYLMTNTRPANAGAYKKENFNEYGDNIYDRPYNEMTQVTNVINLNFRTNYEDDKETEYEEYIDYLNDYIKFANKKGATVYYSLCPMNEAALGKKNNADVIYDYYRNLVNSINCKVISNVNDYLMDEGYFFDSEFHLNNAGVTVRTVKLIDDIKRERDILTQTLPASELPKPPGFKPAGVVGEESENLYFVLEEVQGNSEVYYKIIGVNDLGKQQVSLTIPDIVNGKPVRVLGENALIGCTLLEELIVGNNIKAIEGRALNGAMALKSLILPDLPGTPESPEDTDPDKSISVPNKTSEALITDDECCPDLKIYVDPDWYSEYAGAYFWGDYGAMLEPKAK